LALSANSHTLKGEEELKTMHQLLLRSVFPLLVLIALQTRPMLTIAQDIPQQINRETVRSIVEGTYNSGNLDMLDAFYTPDYVRHPGELKREEVKKTIAALRDAIPDLKVTINLMVAEGNWVAARLKLQGTLTKPLLLPNSAPIPPNNKPIELAANSLFRLTDQIQIAEEWNGFDNLNFLSQIGALPPVNPPPPTPDTMEMLQSNTIQQQKEAVTAYLDAVSNNDLTTLQGRLSDDFTGHNPFGLQDRLALVKDLFSLHSALPDLQTVPVQVISEGDWVAALYTMSGTFTRNFTTPDGSTAPPTGKSINLPVITFYKIAPTGGISQSWELYDSWDFLVQLGLVKTG
jgi:predicted ester cyclase